jgi:hypothetical protein
VEALSADGVLMLSILLYPGLLTEISKKNQFEKTGNLSKSYFIGKSKLNWKELFESSFFSHEPDQVAELFDLNPESIQKLFSLYVERSAALFKSNDIILWLKEIAGFVCD